MVQSFAAELFGVSRGCRASRVLNHLRTAFKTLMSITEGCGVEPSPPGMPCTEKGVCGRSWAQRLLLSTLLPWRPGATSLLGRPTWQLLVRSRPACWDAQASSLLSSAPLSGPALGGGVVRRLCAALSPLGRGINLLIGFAVVLGRRFLQQRRCRYRSHECQRLSQQQSVCCVIRDHHRALQGAGGARGTRRPLGTCQSSAQKDRTRTPGNTWL